MQTVAYVGSNPLGASFSKMNAIALPTRLTRSRFALIVICVLLTAGLGYVDYLTGYEQTFLLFYLVPIGLGTWFGDFWLGFTFSVMSIGAWVVSDVAAGVPTGGVWNIGLGLGS